MYVTRNGMMYCPCSILSLSHSQCHAAVLCESAHGTSIDKLTRRIHTQVDSWQHASTASADPSSQQPETEPDKLITLTVGSAEELPAAEAVIATLYGVQGSLQRLYHGQLVQALLIADMIGAAEAAIQATQHLRTAAQQGLSAAALELMAGLSAWPQCLLELLPVIVAHANCCKQGNAELAAVPDPLAAVDGSLIQRVLLRVFGDLQAVWQDPKLKAMLMQLPCPAMQLILSSDDLQVPSEDIVLYTAQQYVTRLPADAGREVAKSALAGLIRAPRLSDAMLHHTVVLDGSSSKLLGRYMTQLKELLLLRRILWNRQGGEFKAELASIEDTPKSWQLDQRQIVPIVPARVVWQLSVQHLKQACLKAYEEQKSEVLLSRHSPPISGFAWRFTLDIEAKEAGVTLNVYFGPVKMSTSFFLSFHFSLNCNGKAAQQRVPCMKGNYTWHIDEFPDVGVMAGGWDEAAWAAQGLPTEGDLVFELEVSHVA